jgi:hypothetical protein
VHFLICKLLYKVKKRSKESSLMQSKLRKVE